MRYMITERFLDPGGRAIYQRVRECGWSDLVEFEVAPVICSDEAAQAAELS